MEARELERAETNDLANGEIWVIGPFRVRSSSVPVARLGAAILFLGPCTQLGTIQ